jgi:TetR/AcrR family transcriptional repressor of nem operon
LGQNIPDLTKYNLEMTERSLILTPDYSEMTKAEKTRQFIIERSAELFNTKGIAGTAMSDIMEATRLAKGSLYVHFENKEDLAFCAVDYNLNRLAEKTVEEMSKHSGSKDKLMAGFRFLSDTSNPPVTGGCPMLNFGMEADDTDPMIRQRVNKAVGNTIRLISSVIEAGIKNKEFKENIDAKRIATKIFAMLEGGIMMSKISGNGKQLNTVVEMIGEELEAIGK